jgi:hypothetical protein
MNGDASVAEFPSGERCARFNGAFCNTDCAPSKSLSSLFFRSISNLKRVRLVEFSASTLKGSI